MAKSVKFASARRTAPESIATEPRRESAGRAGGANTGEVLRAFPRIAPEYDVDDAFADAPRAAASHAKPELNDLAAELEAALLNDLRSVASFWPEPPEAEAGEGAYPPAGPVEAVAAAEAGPIEADPPPITRPPRLDALLAELPAAPALDLDAASTPAAAPEQVQRPDPIAPVEAAPISDRIDAQWDGPDDAYGDDPDDEGEDLSYAEPDEFAGQRRNVVKPLLIIVGLVALAAAAAVFTVQSVTARPEAGAETAAAEPSVIKVVKSSPDEPAPPPLKQLDRAAPVRDVMAEAETASQPEAKEAAADPAPAALVADGAGPSVADAARAAAEPSVSASTAADPVASDPTAGAPSIPEATAKDLAASAPADPPPVADPPPTALAANAAPNAQSFTMDAAPAPIAVPEMPAAAEDTATASDAVADPAPAAPPKPKAPAAKVAAAKVAPVAKRPAGTAPSAGPAQVTSAVKLRGNPDNGAPVVGMLAAGQTVQVISCKIWCEVTAGDKRGFVFQRFLQGGRVAGTP